MVTLDWDNFSTWSVLLVDDEPDNVEVVAETLQFYGMTVRTAENGAAGLDTLQEFVPDLIILDLSMPVMDGWEMRTRLKEDPQTSHIPVLALSAHAMSGDKERALEAGFDGYMPKPIKVPTLIQDLRAALEENAAPSADVASLDGATAAPSASAVPASDGRAAGEHSTGQPPGAGDDGRLGTNQPDDKRADATPQTQSDITGDTS
ncbi:MAG: response regulator [Chloroflexi bacterium]|nr:response regulator [Chloroflexota bacterium]